MMKETEGTYHKALKELETHLFMNPERSVHLSIIVYNLAEALHSITEIQHMREMMGEDGEDWKS